MKEIPDHSCSENTLHSCSVYQREKRTVVAEVNGQSPGGGWEWGHCAPTIDVSNWSLEEFCPIKELVLKAVRFLPDAELLHKRLGQVSHRWQEFRCRVPGRGQLRNRRDVDRRAV